ncbi:MAG: DUF86 domain-containing protein [Nanoarchaeota archaeon]
MKKDDSVFLEHILDSIEKIEEFTRNVSKSDFLNNVQLQDAVVRRIEILGEAAKNISQIIVEKHPEVEWKKMIGTRDKLVHGYFGVDLEITWLVVKDDLPELKKKIKNILHNFKITK